MRNFWKSIVVASLLSVAASSVSFAATLEQMAGQMIVVGFQGDSVTDKSVVAIRALIDEGRIGGVMYLKTNVKSLDAVRQINTSFHETASVLPPFITLDQEGGAVERLTKDVGFKEIATAQRIAASMTPAQAETVYGTMAKAIADLGFTVNFGPVVDLDINRSNPIIGKFGRSYGTDPKTVESYSQAFVSAHHSQGLLTALKHFPGHGSSTGDSHEGFVDISSTWQEKELDPYRLAIADGYADFVMVGHLYHKDYTAKGQQTPASLSHRWITDVLRKDIGFQGVVISDDLEMGAIREHFTTKQTVIDAVNAGMDVLLFSNTADYHPSLPNEIRTILVTQAQADPAFAVRIEQSYNRIVKLKSRLAQ